jgi:hypothetical protein
MSLRYGLKTARDLFEKLKRDADALRAGVASDGLFNFVVTGYHLCEWVAKDPSLSTAAKAEAEVFRDEEVIQVCRDLANASKHWTITYYTPSVDTAESRQGWGCFRWGRGTWGVGEEETVITMKSGGSYNALELKDRVVALWEAFFSKHGPLHLLRITSADST